MKRSQSSATDVVLLKSSSSELSVVSLPQNPRHRRKRDTSSQQSVISIDTAPSKENWSEDESMSPVPPHPDSDLENSFSHKSSGLMTATTSKTTMRRPLSNLDFNRDSEPQLFKMTKPLSSIPCNSVDDWDNFLMRSDSFPRTSNTAAIMEEKKKKPAPRKRRQRRRERSMTPESESETDTEDVVTLHSDRSRESSVARSPDTSLSRTKTDQFDVLESEQDEDTLQELDDFQEDETTREETNEERQERQHHTPHGGAFSSNTVETLLVRLSKPEHALAVEYNSRRLDNGALFDLLMSVQAIELCINRMYSCKNETEQRDSVQQMQEKLFGETNCHLSRLIKSILAEKSEYAELCQKDEQTANYFLNLVVYLVEIFVYYEGGLAGFRVFDMKLAEIYEANKSNLVPILTMIIKLHNAAHHDEEDREQSRNFDLKQLQEQKKKFSLAKIELAGQFLDRPTSVKDEAAKEPSFKYTDEQRALIDKLAAAEDLNDLDASSKTELIRQLVEIIMFDGVTFRSYVNDLEAHKNETIRTTRLLDEELREFEEKYVVKRPTKGEKLVAKSKEEEEAEEAAGKKQPKIPYKSREKYNRTLEKFYDAGKSLESTKHILANAAGPKPVISVSSTGHLSVNMWTFDSLMPNFLLVEKRQFGLDSPAPKSAWYQIGDVDTFLKGLKILLPHGEYEAVNKSLRKSTVFTDLNLTLGAEDAASKLDFLSRLSAFYAGLVPEKPTESTKRIIDDDDDDVRSSSEYFKKPLEQSESIIKKLTKIYDRVLASNLQEFKIREADSDDAIPRYEIETSEDFINLVESWPILVRNYGKNRPGRDQRVLEPIQKEKLLSDLGDLGELLLDSVPAASQSFRFSGVHGLGDLLRDFLSRDCKTLQAMDLFVTVLGHNIRWEKSLENVECEICGAVKRDGDFVQNTKLKCNECEQHFHYGCLTYDEDETAETIAYFVYDKKRVAKELKCSWCLNQESRKKDELRKKAQELHSVDVNDYKLRSNRTRNYNVDDALGLTKTRRREKLSRTNSNNSSSGSSYVPKKRRAKREDSFLVEDSDNDDDEGGRRSKRTKRAQKDKEAVYYTKVPASTRTLRPKKAVNYDIDQTLKQFED